MLTVKEITLTHSINLSKRLKTVASFLPKGALFADIGSDHAYLPCYVCLADPKARAIAGEVNQGPYESARETVDLFGLKDQIDVCLGDGLQVIENRKVNQLTIAGMGGSLITSILDSGVDYLDSVTRIIVQPNIGAKNIRKWFLQNDFTITHELIVEENEHIYEILVADKGQKNSPYTDEMKEKQLFFGPLLLQEKSPSFYKKWRIQQDKVEQVIHQMTQATVVDNEKIDKFKKELQWITEVIDNG